MKRLGHAVRVASRALIAWVVMSGAVVVSELPGGTTHTLLHKHLVYPVISTMTDGGFSAFAATSTAAVLRYSLFLGIAVGIFCAAGLVPHLRTRGRTSQSA